MSASLEPKQIQTALELYYNDTDQYPLTEEMISSIATGSNIYMAKIPTRIHRGASITRYCYSEIVGNCDVYGGLYAWATIMNGQASSVAILSGGPGDLP